MAVQSFLEINLPEPIERGQQGGPRFSTTVFEAASGREQRNVNWSRVRGRWTVGSGLRDLALLNLFRDFFYVMQGRATGFRFKDWADFRIIEGPIGTGDGVTTVFNVVKRYSASGNHYDRRIAKIVAGTYHVFVDGGELTEGSGAGKFQIDANTGIVTLGTAPDADAAVTITTDFAVPVRFDTDDADLLTDWIADLGAGLEPTGVGEWSGLPIVELRV